MRYRKELLDENCHDIIKLNQTGRIEHMTKHSTKQKLSIQGCGKYSDMDIYLASCWKRKFDNCFSDSSVVLHSPVIEIFQLDLAKPQCSESCLKNSDLFKGVNE